MLILLELLWPAHVQSLSFEVNKQTDNWKNWNTAMGLSVDRRRHSWQICKHLLFACSGSVAPITLCQQALYPAHPEWPIHFICILAAPVQNVEMYCCCFFLSCVQRKIIRSLDGRLQRFGLGGPESAYSTNHQPPRSESGHQYSDLNIHFTDTTASHQNRYFLSSLQSAAKTWLKCEVSMWMSTL